MRLVKEYLGEFIGTFVLTFIGCGAVALAVVFGILPHLFSVALVWGIGVTIAILLTYRYSHAHLNPAVTLGMCVAGQLKWKKCLAYFCFQFLGAYVAAVFLYLLIQPDLASFEALEGITRGGVDSVETAMIFGEFFPNPSFRSTVSVRHWQAFLVEMIGTFLLVFAIFQISRSRVNAFFSAVLIGGTVTLLILCFAPYTQAGLNPARDLAPRLFSFHEGWGSVVFQSGGASLLVYVLAPMIGGVLAAMLRQFWTRKRTGKHPHPSSVADSP